MESASRASRVPSLENLRPGQADVARHFAATWDTVCQLPTGYGKTLTGAACYKAARLAGKADRLLWIVPRRAQADQAAESIPDDMQRMLGVHDLLCDPKGRSRSFNFSAAPTQAYKAHRMGQCEIFVITVQSMMARDTLAVLKEMMQAGRWMVVIDEHHHYGDIETSRWVQEVHALPAACRLAMSATPDRTDGTAYFRKPDVIVGYQAAAKAGAVKRLHLNVYDYILDVTIDGEVRQFTCDELFDLLGVKNPTPEQLQAKEGERGMRWNPKYISPLVEYPIYRMASRRARGLRDQMLVQAMSCSHAQMLCEQIRAIAPDGVRVDWVGTGPNGRTPEQNERVLGEFCPPKDARGVRNWTLDILVNVGMAGEGLDTVDVCEVVFCTRPNLNPSTLQIMGRAARIMRGVTEQPEAHISVDKVSPLREFVGFDVMDAFDGIEIDPDEKETREAGEREDEYKPLPDHPKVWVENVELVDILQSPEFIMLKEHVSRDAGFNSSFESDEAKTAWLLEQYREIKQAEAQKFNGAANVARVREQVAAATTKLTGLLIRRAGGEVRRDKTLPGDIKRKINSRRKFEVGCDVKQADLAQLERHWEFMRRLEAQLLKGEVPTWLA